MAKHSINEAADGFTHSVRFTYADLATTGFLTTGGAANQRVVGEVPPGGYIDLAMLYQITDPSGASDLTIDFNRLYPADRWLREQLDLRC